MSTTNAGGHSAPRAYTITVYRDARGRFTSKPPSEQELLREFEEKGSCSFPDPWRPGGKYIIETRRSLKGFPVAMHYEGPVRGNGDGYSGVIKYGSQAYNWGRELKPGEVAVSPMPWMGDPRSGWGDGQWGMYEEGTSAQVKRQLAALYIHLAHSVDLHTKNCGNRIGVLKNY